MPVPSAIPTFGLRILATNKWLQKFYLNRMYKDRIEAVENELIRDSARLLGAVKQFYQLESWLPEYAGKGFHTKKGE